MCELPSLRAWRTCEICSLASAAVAVPSASAKAAPAAIAPATSTIAASVVGTAGGLWARTRGTDRFGQCLHVLGHDHDLADRAFAHAFASHACFIAHRKMQNAPFAAVHGA